jgi:amidase
MALRLPTDDELRQAAAVHGFRLSAEEIEGFRSLLGPLFGALEQLDEVPKADAAAVGARDPGASPAAGDDPFNAIVRRCSVKGTTSGRLSGKRVGLKDNISVAGVPMTCGSRVLEGYTPDRDATVVGRLLAEGAEIVAILNMDAFAFSAGGQTSCYGPTLNPHDPERVAGGSSGGSAAALYYDDVDLTIGGDQGGSIRVPSSWCGVVGLKPTHGLVPYTGIVGIDQVVDHAGPMGRAAADVALLLEVIAGKDPLDPRQHEVTVEPYTRMLEQGLRGLRVGLLKEGFGHEGAEPDVESAVRAAVDVLRAGGASVEDVSNPSHLEAGGIAWALFTEGMSALLRANGLGYHWEGFYDVRLGTELGRRRHERGQAFPPTLKLALLAGEYLHRHHHGRCYGTAQNRRAALRASYDRLFERVDVLAMPTTPMKAHRRDRELVPWTIVPKGWNMLGNTVPFNVTGHPALSLPCAKSAGLPVGLMLVGRRFADGTLLRAAHAFESRFDWRA